jgi:thiamine biosynthesis lipoprotein
MSKQGQPPVKNVSRATALAMALIIVDSVAASEPLIFDGPTMGTRYRISIASPPSKLDNVHTKEDIELLLAQIDRQMSTYRSDSELSRFNRDRSRDWFLVSRDTAHVVAAAQRISEQTQGALDVTVGPLVRLWHFGPGGSSTGAAHPTRPPPAESVNKARDTIGYEKLDVRTEPPALRKDVERLEVDLSSIAPGFAVDRIAAYLSGQGVKNFMVEIGGEVRARGVRIDGAPWRVGIERPLTDRRELLLAVPLVDAAIATAGDYRKFFEIDGRRFSHIIDPASGQPVDHSVGSVTVVADTCIEADGWDTALLVLGQERGYACAEKHGISALFVMRNGELATARATSAWHDRFGDHAK